MSPQNMTAVEAAVQTFYQRGQQGEVQQVYDDASPLYRNATTLESTQRLIQIAQAAGRNCSAPARDPQNVNTVQSTSGLTVGVMYQRTCPGGALIENFVFRFENGVPKLAGYHLSGDALTALLAGQTPASQSAAPESTTPATTQKPATP
jgi:hypothetical protein